MVTVLTSIITLSRQGHSYRMYHRLQIVQGGKVLQLYNSTVIHWETFTHFHEWIVVSRSHTDHFTGKVYDHQSIHETMKHFHLEPFAIYNNVQVLDSVEEWGRDCVKSFPWCCRLDFPKGTIPCLLVRLSLLVVCYNCTLFQRRSGHSSLIQLYWSAMWRLVL